uniref:Inactive LRR receptor-like serine/threonine-protein kinase BIR2 n=1 Tax=Tanacetum cinerariifolium TaxID=118510 RepID=A0A6L2NCZ3_TANCI|nr:inactive LRR receptor-like serine/threonine-protein kinase BIR2 [Tanacetum cinerariifolium]
MSLIILLTLLLPLLSPLVNGEDDVQCLRGVKSSLNDPQQSLAAWSFGNTTSGYICDFNGVTCWNGQENRLITLSLRGFGLGGGVPRDLRYCESLQNLDLSGNKLTGSIPNDLCVWLPYLVTLDLSDNELTGAIPDSLGNCTFLNSVVLSGNKLSGSIPNRLTNLGRLTKFSVANNELSGSIPSGLGTFGKENFEGNSGLCGAPLRKCGSLSKKSLAIIVAAGVFGAIGSLLLGFGLWWWCVKKGKGKRSGVDRDDDSSSWADRLRGYKLVQVSLFQKPLVKVKLVDLMIATNGFGRESVIVGTKSGTMYRAVLSDGSALAVKRLNKCKLHEKQFRLEMNRLGQLRHPNLTPLLGYCVVEEEKLLVYKYMSNGTLSSALHKDGESLDWPTRFRIAVSAAKGLAWLHHGCRPAILLQNVSSDAIFLDDDYNARLVDFGLARLLTSPHDQPNESSYANGGVGEFGYVAPEYSSTLVASTKGDTYGFGVVLMELATGQKPHNVTTFEEGFKGNCVASQPRARWSMYRVSEALSSVAQELGGSQHYDETCSSAMAYNPDANLHATSTSCVDENHEINWLIHTMRTCMLDEDQMLQEF